MTSWKIIKDRLPTDVREAVLRVNVSATDSDQWKLLRSGNTRRVYLYQAAKGTSSWLVKWGYRYSFHHWLKASVGESDASVEASATHIAAEAGIPTIPFQLVATTPRWRWPLETLLVSEFLEGSCTFHAAVQSVAHMETRVKDFLIKLAVLAAQIHAAGLLHGDFSATNIIVGEDNRLRVVDWLKSRKLNEGDLSVYRQDIVRALGAFFLAGLQRRHMDFFLSKYLERMKVEPRKRSRCLKELPIDAMKGRQRVAIRAARNCTRASRRLEIFSTRGYRVYMFKGRDKEIVTSRMLNPNRPQREENGDIWVQFQSAASERNRDSELLHYWRMANALERSGLSGHVAAAFAVRGRRSPQEVLLCQIPHGSRPLIEWLGNAKSRRRLLQTIGSFVRRLHALGMNLSRLDLKTWLIAESASGRFTVMTTDLKAYEFNTDADIIMRFHWLIELIKKNGRHKFSSKDLVAFMKSYGEGYVDRKLQQFFSDTCMGHDGNVA